MLAIIPARGGSQGIPNKNIVQLGSVPLIAYSIYAARQSNKIDKVVVSTDSNEIGDIATQWGAQVIDRPSDISGPDSPTESALIHAIDSLSSTGYIHHIACYSNQHPHSEILIQLTMRYPHY